jgi:Cu(I)/Ag(I) efflux system membrane fusion protein
MIRLFIVIAVIAAAASAAVIVHHRHASPPVAVDSDIAYWTCSMHPSVHNAIPGKCPICAMNLTPVRKGSAQSLEIVVEPTRRQELGIRTETIGVKPLTLEVRAAGRVVPDEAALTEVSLRVGGWVASVHALDGALVRAGDPLISISSPDLLAAARELQLAARPDAAGGAELLQAARERLRRWGLTDAQLDAVAAAKEPPPVIDILAPAAGSVLEKTVVQGAAFTAGQALYRIADLGHVWVLADLAQEDLPAMKVGQEATLTIAALPGQRFTGAIDQLYPALDATTRTARARIALANPELKLRPAMFATATMTVALGDRLQVPRSAVIYTGPRRVVFVDLGEGRLRPKEVRLGLAGADAFEVLDGLAAGDAVVSSGTFLVAAESRIHSAETFWGGGDARR